MDIKVKRRKSFILCLMMFFYLLYSPVYPLEIVTVKTQHGRSLKDSLRILDSAVNANKILNNQLSVKLAKRALEIAYTLKTDSAMAEAYKMMGIAYSPTEKDSSYFYSATALKIASKVHSVELRIPIIYNLAMLSDAAYNYKEAILLLDSSIRLATSVNDYSGISRAYNALGNINTDIHNYEGARQMYESALRVARKNTLYQQMGVALANLAKEEFEKDNIKSVLLQKEALGYLQKVKGTEEEMAYLFINMGNRFSNPDSALFYYKAAVDLGVNANLTKVMLGAYNNMTYSYLDKKDLAMAESCLKDHAIPLALKEADHDWLSSLYDTYADVYIAKNDPRSGLEMQKKALKERVKDYKQKASDQLRLLSALLDLKNKELIIQNEEKELLVQRSRLQRLEFWLVIAFFLVILSVFITLILQQRSRAKLQREQINSARRIIEMEENEKGRTARELHDLTGQLMMGIAGTVEEIEFPEKEIKSQIQAKIQELGAGIRRISHRMNRAMIEYFTFNELISGLCIDFNKLSGMSVQLDIPVEFTDLPNELVVHFYRITQELLTNAGKYAPKSQVVIAIKMEKDKLYLHYSDTGPGFLPGEKEKASMGIRNIFERTKLINGQAKLNSAPGKGTTWEIIFPVGPKNSVKNT